MEATNKLGDNERVALGKAIQRWREEKNMKRLELAKLVGMSKPAICLIENGHRAPAFGRYGAFAEALGKTPGDLMEAAYAQN